MKKSVLVLAFATVFALGLVGCGGSTQSSSSTSSSESSSSMVGMANPWSAAASAEEAAAGAGIDSFAVPAEDLVLNNGPLAPWTFQYMEGIAQADGYVGAAMLMIRKGTAPESDDISGDYNQYKHEWTQNIKGLEVQCFGNEEGRATKALWSVGDTDYCILAYAQGDDPLAFGLDADDLKSLVNGIQ